MMNLFVQYRLFISSILIGIYLGVTYDLLFHFVSSKLNKIIRFIIDLLFFIIQAMIVFRFLYKINHAIIPLYTYFLFLFGFIIYQYFSDDYYEKRIEPLQQLTKKGVVVIKKCLYWGFVDPYVLFYKRIRKRFKKLKYWYILKRKQHKIKKKERKAKNAKKKAKNKIKKMNKREQRLIKRKNKQEKNQLNKMKKKKEKQEKKKQKIQKKNKYGDADAKKKLKSSKGE